MAVKSEISYASVDELMLDPLNPRLGRGNTGPAVKQSTILSLMRDWTLDELAVSFLESGFWPQEALIVVREKLYGKDALVVVEGNRRLAALKFLKRAASGEKIDRRWREIVEETAPPTDLFDHVPYIEVASRKDVEAFLGFRHVTGIKEWKPAEKAEYIAKLIEGGLSYAQVMRKIGSKTPTVRQNYISYRLLLQMEDQEKISVEHVEDKFSVLFLSLRTDGVQRYLDETVARLNRYLALEAPPASPTGPTGATGPEPAIVFGRVPLFYFVLHFYAAHAVAVVLAVITYGSGAWGFLRRTASSISPLRMVLGDSPVACDTAWIPPQPYALASAAAH